MNSWPCYFLVYINDKVNDISPNLHLFVDESSFLICIYNQLTAEKTINADLKQD